MNRLYTCTACDRLCERCGKELPYGAFTRLLMALVGLAALTALVTYIPGCPPLPFWERMAAIAAIRGLVRR